MTPQQEHEFETKAEKMLAGQREVPSGRNFLAWTMRYQNFNGYRDRFDDTFSFSPGSDGWMKENFCQKCGMRKAWCRCGKEG